MALLHAGSIGINHVRTILRVIDNRNRADAAADLRGCEGDADLTLRPWGE